MSSELKSLFDAAPWRTLSRRDIGHTLKVPTMLHMEESKFYFWMAGMFASDGGTIVDLGSFVGGSTARLAGGLMAGKDAGGASGTVHAYDRFTAGEKTKRNVLYPAGIPEFEGNDILQMSKDLLAPFVPHVVHHPGDIDEGIWDGGPIDILVHDASKTRVSADRHAAIFWPHLKAGSSILSQQDLVHAGHPWVAIQMELWADHFEPLAFVRQGTIAFLCTKTPSPADLAERSVSRMTPVEELVYLAKARARYGPLAPRVDRELRRAEEVLAENPRAGVAWQLTKKA